MSGNGWCSPYCVGCTFKAASSGESGHGQPHGNRDHGTLQIGKHAPHVEAEESTTDEDESVSEDESVLVLGEAEPVLFFLFFFFFFFFFLFVSTNMVGFTDTDPILKGSEIRSLTGHCNVPNLIDSEACNISGKKHGSLVILYTYVEDT